MAVHSLIRDDLLVTDADTVVRSSGSIKGSGLAGLLIHWCCQIGYICHSRIVSIIKKAKILASPKHITPISIRATMIDSIQQ